MAHHQVAVITPTQKDELVGHEWQPRSYFNPIQDCYDEWVISQEEVEGTHYLWLIIVPNQFLQSPVTQVNF